MFYLLFLVLTFFSCIIKNKKPDSEISENITELLIWEKTIDVGLVKLDSIITVDHIIENVGCYELFIDNIKTVYRNELSKLNNCKINNGCDSTTLLDLVQESRDKSHQFVRHQQSILLLT